MYGSRTGSQQDGAAKNAAEMKKKVRARNKQRISHNEVGGVLGQQRLPPDLYRSVDRGVSNTGKNNLTEVETEVQPEARARRRRTATQNSNRRKLPSHSKNHEGERTCSSASMSSVSKEQTASNNGTDTRESRASEERTKGGSSVFSDGSRAVPQPESDLSTREMPLCSDDFSTEHHDTVGKKSVPGSEGTAAATTTGKGRLLAKSASGSDTEAMFAAGVPSFSSAVAAAPAIGIAVTYPSQNTPKEVPLSSSSMTGDNEGRQNQHATATKNLGFDLEHEGDGEAVTSEAENIVGVEEGDGGVVEESWVGYPTVTTGVRMDENGTNTNGDNGVTLSLPSARALCEAQRTVIDVLGGDGSSNLRKGNRQSARISNSVLTAKTTPVARVRRDGKVGEADDDGVEDVFSSPPPRSSSRASAADHSPMSAIQTLLSSLDTKPRRVSRAHVSGSGGDGVSGSVLNSIPYSKRRASHEGYVGVKRGASPCMPVLGTESGNATGRSGRSSFSGEESKSVENAATVASSGTTNGGGLVSKQKIVGVRAATADADDGDESSRRRRDIGATAARFSNEMARPPLPRPSPAAASANVAAGGGNAPAENGRIGFVGDKGRQMHGDDHVLSTSSSSFRTPRPPEPVSEGTDASLRRLKATVQGEGGTEDGITATSRRSLLHSRTSLFSSGGADGGRRKTFYPPPPRPRPASLGGALAAPREDGKSCSVVRDDDDGASVAAAAAASGGSNNGDNFEYRGGRDEDEDENDSVDATCIPYGCNVEVRTRAAHERNALCCRRCEDENIVFSSSTASNLASKRQQQHSPEIRYVADADSGCGGGWEDWEDGGVHSFRIARTSISSSASASSQLRQLGLNASSSHLCGHPSTVVRYGDVIALHSKAANNRALGVRRSRRLAGESCIDGVGVGADDEGGGYVLVFNRSVLGHAEKWQVLCPHDERGGPVTIRVGSRLSSTPRSANANDSATVETTAAADVALGRPVRSGSALVLQNVSMGGLLALDTDFDAIAAKHVGGAVGRSCMTVVSRGHGLGNVVVPGPYETWTIVQCGTPQCPPSDWNTKRQYLTGSYHVDGRRNRVTSRERQLFGIVEKKNKSDGVLDGGDGEVEGRRQPSGSQHPLSKSSSCHSQSKTSVDLLLVAKDQPFRLQEMILLDELLGAMMGLEGRYLKACDFRIASLTTEQSSASAFVNGNDGRDFYSDEKGQDGCVALGSPSRRSPGGGVTCVSTSGHIASISFFLVPNPVPARPSRLASTEWDSTGIFDTSLRHLVEQILPLCSDFVRVNAFVNSRLSRYEYGFVAQAFASAVDELLQEYLVFVCHMENMHRKNKLTTQKLWCYVQPPMRTLRVLSDASLAASTRKGGELLNSVHDIASSHMDGDRRAREILAFLLEKAGRPYLDMLESWIYTGRVYDPYAEFMIDAAENTSFAFSKDAVRNDYFSERSWEKSYRVRAHHVCHMLLGSSSDLSDKVLTTGKYLNVIRECGQNSSTSSSFDDGEMKYGERARRYTSKKNTLFDLGDEAGSNLQPLGILSFSGYGGGGTTTANIADVIENAFDSAAETLLRLILVDHRLVERLESIKRYFLLDQGDFFVQFLDVAEEELLNDVDRISRGRVQSLLSMSVQASGGGGGGGGGGDPFRDDLLCVFAADHLTTFLDSVHRMSGGILAADEAVKTPSRHAYGFGPESEGLRGIEAFMLDYRVDWPLSLILSKRVMTNYQLIFRHLFFAKYVERRLFGTWLDHQMIKAMNLRSVLGRTYGLRQRMLHFMQNFVYYMMFEVIDPHWNRLLLSFGSAKTVEDIIRIHGIFEAAILKECLLTNSELLRILTKLMRTCINFADQMKLFFQKTGIDEDFANAATDDRLARWNATTKRKALLSRLAIMQENRRVSVANHTQNLRSELSGMVYRRMIDRLSTDFDTSVADFVAQLTRDSSANLHLSNLSTRLDYNEFISASIVH